MKKRRCILFLSLLFLVAAAGCNREQEWELLGEADDTTTIEARITTRNVADGLSLGLAEKVINRLRVYAFDGNRLDKMVYKEYAGTQDVALDMKVRKTSAKMLYVIVNEPTDAATQSRLALIDNPAAFDALEYQMADYFTSIEGTVLNSAASFSSDDFCLPMFGKTESPFDAAAESVQPVQMTVQRSLARVDIYIQKDPSVTRMVVFDGDSTFDIANTCAKGYFSLQEVPAKDLALVEGVPAAKTGLLVPKRNLDNNDAAVRLFSFYTPARSCPSDAERLAFTLKGVKFNASNINFSNIIIGNQKDNILEKIEHNKVYQVFCTLQNSEIDLSTSILDWEDVGVTGDIVPSPVLHVLRSRIVMDYAAQNNSFTTRVDYLSNGAVSFVGYVVDGRMTIDGKNLPTWLPKANIAGLPDGNVTSGTLSLTYVPTADAHPDVVLRIKAGNITKDITVVYDSGFLPNAELRKQGWTTNLPTNGLQLAKRGNVLPSSAADANWDGEKMIFATSQNPSLVLPNGYGAGPNNFKLLRSELGNAPIIRACYSLGADYYIPSLNELLTVAENLQLLGTSYTFPALSPANLYFSSSRNYSSQGETMFGVGMNAVPGPIALEISKPYGLRCVRNL